MQKKTTSMMTSLYHPLMFLARHRRLLRSIPISLCPRSPTSRYPIRPLVDHAKFHPSPKLLLTRARGVRAQPRVVATRVPCPRRATCLVASKSLGPLRSLTPIRRGVVALVVSVRHLLPSGVTIPLLLGQVPVTQSSLHHLRAQHHGVRFSMPSNHLLPCRKARQFRK